MNSKTLILYLSIILTSCNNSTTELQEKTNETTVKPAVYQSKHNLYKTIEQIPLPEGFKRISSLENSFAKWLLHVKLKKDKTVYKFDGSKKGNQAAQFAVLDIPVGNIDLQQCADAVMRLKATYLFSVGRYKEINFKDNEGKVYQFNAPYTSINFERYLQKVFAMCGSSSLSKQLTSIPLKDIEPGDVLIRGGFPGHAVIVMDVAINDQFEKIYLLAQSYMPAQDIHVLINPSNSAFSPWYLVTDDALIKTPEYTFKKSELKTW